jgi:hypothetical protein
MRVVGAKGKESISTINKHKEMQSFKNEEDATNYVSFTFITKLFHHPTISLKSPRTTSLCEH